MDVMGKFVWILLLTHLSMATSVAVELHYNPGCCSMSWASIFMLQRQSTTAFDPVIQYQAGPN